MSILSNKKVTSFYEQVTKELATPDVYKYIPSNIIGDLQVKDYTGVSINTYYKGDKKYEEIGKYYLSFKSIVIQTPVIPNLSQSDKDSVTTISGYDESISAIKNISKIFGQEQVFKYDKYVEYINDFLSTKTDGAIDSFGEFFKQNTSFTSSDLSYVESIHLFTITNKFFKFSSLVDVSDTSFDLLKLDDFTIKMGGTLKYNIQNKLKYRDLIGSDESGLEIICGCVYEDGNIIICSPFIVNPETISSTNIKSTCLGTLSGSEKFQYSFLYSTTGSVTGTIENYQKVLKTINFGSSFSELLSGTAFPYGIVKGFANATNSSSARIENSAFTNPTTTTHDVNWAVTGSLTSGFLVLRNTVGITFAPVDGNDYTEGTTQGDGTLIVYNGVNYTATSTGLTQGITYNYAVVPYTGSGVNRNYYSPMLQFTGTLFAIEPTAQPTSLTATGIFSSSAIVSFVAASPTAEYYFTLFKVGTAVTDSPTDGVGYSVNDVISADTVASTGSGVSFNFTSLTPQTRYYLRTISYNGTGSAANYYIGGTPTTFNFWTYSVQPSSYATNLQIITRTNNSLDIQFTAANPSVSGYMTLRKASVLPNPTITNGNTYSDGSSMSDSSVSVTSGTATSLTLPSLSPDTEYFIKTVAYNQLTATPATTHYLITNTLTGSTWTLANEPTAQPTALVFSNRTINSATIGWTAGAGSPERYLSLYRASASVTSSPTDGIHYSIGLFPSSSVDRVSGTGTGLSVNLTSLSQGTEYYMRVYSYNGQARPSTASTGSENYYLTTPLEGSFWTLTAEPTAQPTSFLLSSKTDTSITFTFTNSSPASSAYTSLRKTSSAPDETLLVDGTLYSDGTDLGSGTFSVTSGTSNSIVNTSLSPKTQYFFKVLSYNQVSGQPTTRNYFLTSPLTGSIWTLDTEPANSSTNLLITATNDGNGATVGFSKASSITGTFAIIKQGSAPTADPTDGTVYSLPSTIGDGSATAYETGSTLNIAGLAQAQQYFLKLYSYNIGADNSTINYKIASPLAGSFWTLTAEPTATPTNLTVTARTTTSLSFSFTAASPAPTHYYAGRHPSNPTSDFPVDSNVYANGSTIGGATTISGALTSTSFDANGLAAGTLYYIRVLSYNRVTNDATANYRHTALTGSFYTLATEPTNAPSAINLVSANSRTNSSISASWTKDGNGTLFTVRAGAYGTTHPTDGSYYSVGNAIGNANVSFTGTGVSNQPLLGGLAADTIYYFNIYSYNEPSTNYKTGSYLTWTCRTLANAPTNAPSVGSVSSITITSATIATSATAGTTNYLSAYKVGSDFTGSDLPTDGQYYSGGNVFGAGYVISLTTAGSSISYSNGSIYNSQIFIRVFSQNGTNTVGSLTGTSNKFYNTYSSTSFYLDATRPNSASNFNYDIDGYPNYITLHFGEPAGPTPGDLRTGFLVLKRTGSSASGSIAAHPTDNVFYTSGSTIGGYDVLTVTTNTTFNDSGVTYTSYDPVYKAGTRVRYKLIPYQVSGSNVKYATTGIQLYIPEVMPP